MADFAERCSCSVYPFHTFILLLLFRFKMQDISPNLFVIIALVGSNLFDLFLMYAPVEKPILKTLRAGLTKTSFARVRAPV